MTSAACTTTTRQELLEYWLGELAEAHELRLEEHLLACSACSTRLSSVVALGTAIRREFSSGTFGVVLPAPFVRRVKEAGVRVREYSLAPGGSVNCTVSRDDDLVVAYLRAPLGDVGRLDVLIDDSTFGAQRLNDVPFDREADALVVVPSTAALRTLRYSRQRMKLVAVKGAAERVIAEYVFNHYPS